MKMISIVLLLFSFIITNESNAQQSPKIGKMVYVIISAPDTSGYYGNIFPAITVSRRFDGKADLLMFTKNTAINITDLIHTDDIGATITDVNGQWGWAYLNEVIEYGVFTNVTNKYIPPINTPDNTDYSDWYDDLAGNTESFLNDTTNGSGRNLLATRFYADKKATLDKGTAIFSGIALTTQYTVTHGLGYTPTSILIQPKSSDAAAVCFTDNYTSTTFRITFITVPNIGTNNITFDWFSLR